MPTPLTSRCWARAWVPGEPAHGPRVRLPCIRLPPDQQVAQRMGGIGLAPSTWCAGEEAWFKVVSSATCICILPSCASQASNDYWVFRYAFNMGEWFLFFFFYWSCLLCVHLFFYWSCLPCVQLFFQWFYWRELVIIQIIVFLDCLRPVAQSKVAANKVICILFCCLCWAGQSFTHGFVSSLRDRGPSMLAGGSVPSHHSIFYLVIHFLIFFPSSLDCFMKKKIKKWMTG